MENPNVIVDEEEDDLILRGNQRPTIIEIKEIGKRKTSQVPAPSDLEILKKIKTEKGFTSTITTSSSSSNSVGSSQGNSHLVPKSEPLPLSYIKAEATVRNATNLQVEIENQSNMEQVVDSLSRPTALERTLSSPTVVNMTKASTSSIRKLPNQITTTTSRSSDKKPRTSRLPAPKPEDLDKIETTKFRRIAQCFREELVHLQVFPEKLPDARSIPNDLPLELQQALLKIGVKMPYSHQLEARNVVRSGHDLVITTPTSSGKSLCFSLPIFEALLGDPDSTAIFLFPIKALANDQLKKLKELNNSLPERKRIPFLLVTGDNKPEDRERAFSSKTPPRIVISNPDTLHYHLFKTWPGWRNFVWNLRFIVVDEAHTYVGSLGVHTANILRRLYCLLSDVGADYNQVKFILSTATVANPLELCSRLISRPLNSPQHPMTLISESGARTPARTVLCFQPQGEVINEIVLKKLRAVVFVRTVIGVNTVDSVVQSKFPSASRVVRGYYSSLPLETKARTLQDLEDGRCQVVITTNALEAGIDIPALDVAVLVGFPGSKMSFWQRVGRAGRKNPGLVIFIPSQYNAMDFFYAEHPDVLLGKQMELANFNPSYDTILQKHVFCAASVTGIPDLLLEELFGPAARDYVQKQKDSGALYLRQFSDGRTVWKAYDPDKKPDGGIRGCGKKVIAKDLDYKEHLEEVDEAQAISRLFPGARFPHRNYEGEVIMYKSESLDLEKGEALLTKLSKKEIFDKRFTNGLRNVTALITKELGRKRFILGNDPQAELHVTYGTGPIQVSTVGYQVWKEKTLEKEVHFPTPYTVTHEAPCIRFQLTQKAADKLSEGFQSALSNLTNQTDPEFSNRRSHMSESEGSFVALHTMIHQFQKATQFWLLSAGDLLECATSEHTATLADSIDEGSGACEMLFHRFSELCERAVELTTSCSFCNGSGWGCGLCVYASNCPDANHNVLVKFGLEGMKLTPISSSYSQPSSSSLSSNSSSSTPQSSLQVSPGLLESSLVPSSTSSSHPRSSAAISLQSSPLLHHSHSCPSQGLSGHM